jgi:hypothetical protein
MAAEEDKKFDAVLGGFLINDLRARAGNFDCPESDVLAAYHERSLPPGEMNSWKEHMVGCTRCQAVLAELEGTDSIPLRASAEASEKEEALRPNVAPPAAVARQEQKPMPAKFPQKYRITPIFPGLRWQWLAPLGALAAGLLVWVAWQENRPRLWKTPAEVKTAKLEPSSKSAPQPASPGPPALSPQLDQAQTDRLARLSKDQPAAGRALSEETRMSNSLQQLEKSDARVRSAPVRPPAKKERGARENAAQDLVAGAAENQPAQEPQAGAAGAAQTAEGQTEAANAQRQARQSQLSVQRSAEPTPLAEAEAGKKSIAEARALARRSAAAAPLSGSAPAAFNDVSASQALMARASDLNLIVTPNKKTLWRAGRAGMIEFSSDGGASWSRQTSDVLVDLTAGSAPSEKVCWIVGRAGTLLLTTDAGSHWAILHSPLEEDLGGVRSSDARHATIWNLGNTKVFETADGGVTWKPAASP